MKTKRSTVVMVIVGLVLCVVIVGTGAAAWFFLSVFDSTASDETSAGRAFDEVRTRFGGSRPVIEIRENDTQIVLTRKPPEVAPARQLQRVQILTWDPEDATVSTITLPWWLVRLKEGTIDFTSEVGSGFTSTQIDLSIEDIERYGPALLVDHEERGGARILVWTE